jgi:hypothetical protein
MKIYTGIAQGSDGWHALRMGIPTASEFHRIVTPKKGELSKGAIDYALRLCAERLLNAPTHMLAGDFSGPWMERGKELEPMAVQQYEFQYDTQTMPISFITTDDGMIGCSPDRLVLSEQKVALEVKCPSPQVHLGYLLNGTDEAYRPQVQGQIYVAELDRAELYSFHERMPAVTIRNTRDDEYVKKLDAALKAFNENLMSMLARAKELGVYQPMPRSVTPVEAIEAEDIARHFKHEAGLRMAKEGFTA